jgi:hypothetical protein
VEHGPRSSPSLTRLFVSFPLAHNLMLQHVIWLHYVKNCRLVVSLCLHTVKIRIFLLSLASILSTAIVEWMLQSLESIPVSCLVAFCVHLDLCPSSWRLAICCLCCLHPICYVSVQLEQSFWLPCSLALCHHPHQVSVVRTTDMCPEIKKLVPLINKSIDQTSEI